MISATLTVAWLQEGLEGLSISETDDLLGFSCTTVSGVYTEWCERQKTSEEQRFCGR